MLISRVKNLVGRWNYWFFKLVKPVWKFKVKHGKEFHGIVIGNEVHTTEGRYR